MTIMKNVEFDVAPLFPTPVGYYHVRDFQNTFIDPENYSTDEYNHNTNQELTINSVSNNILLKEEFKELREIIEGMMEHYIYMTLMFPRSIKLNLVCSWGAIGFPNAYTKSHLHTNSLYSGVFYLKSLEQSGDLEFWKPTNANTFCNNALKPRATESNILNSDSWSITPKTGDCFIFPSHLEHSVTPNKSGENRCVVAFNYYLKGEISTETTLGLTL